MKILQKLFHLHSFDADHLSQHLRFNLGTLQDVRYNLLSVRCCCHSPRSCRSFFMFFHQRLPHQCVQTTRQGQAGMFVDFTGLVKSIKHTSFKSRDCFSFPRPPFSLSLVSLKEPQRSLSVLVVLHVFYFSCKLYILSVIGDHFSAFQTSIMLNLYFVFFPVRDTQPLIP